MFTLQSNLLSKTSLEGSPDPQRDVVSAVAQCNAPLEHRGPLYLTQPNSRPQDIGGFEGPADLQPPPDPRPPWQNIPFVPLPFLPFPPMGNPPWMQPVDELTQNLFFNRPAAINVPGVANINIALFNKINALKANFAVLNIGNQDFQIVPGPVMDVYVDSEGLKVKKSTGYALMTTDKTTETLIC